MNHPYVDVSIQSPSNTDRKKRALIEYMRVKIEDSDWHAVSDAANDLREIEAEERAKKVIEQQTQQLNKG